MVKRRRAILRLTIRPPAASAIHSKKKIELSLGF